MNGATDLMPIADSTNPFVTRRTRPGAIPFFFPPGRDTDWLMTRLERSQWNGQIVGSHGSGKSTLLETFGCPLTRAGRQVERYRPSPGWFGLSVSDFYQESRRWSAKTQVVIDGFEQLSWICRQGLRVLCRRRSCGLLVTTHRAAELPVLFQTTTNLATAQAIVKHLLPTDCKRITTRDIADSFTQQKGNIREVLFALYDIYEQRRG